MSIAEVLPRDMYINLIYMYFCLHDVQLRLWAGKHVSAPDAKGATTECTQ